jgi:hypothetical protein
MQKERLFEETLVPAKPGSDLLFDVSYGYEASKPVECLGMTFPNDESRRRMEQVSFQSRDAQDKGLQHVSLEDARIRRLIQQLPRVIVTEPIHCVRFATLPAEVLGYWSLWRIALDKQSLRDVKIITIFHHDDGRNLVPTARHIWDTLMEDQPEVELVGKKTGGEVEAIFYRLRSEAERQGEDAFHELHVRHQQRLKREQEKGQYAFQARREALGRLGLPEVRQYRLKRLDEEEQAWVAEMRKREQILPDLQPISLLRVVAAGQWLHRRPGLCRQLAPRLCRLRCTVLRHGQRPHGVDKPRIERQHLQCGLVDEPAQHECFIVQLLEVGRADRPSHHRNRICELGGIFGKSSVSAPQLCCN